MRGIDEFGDGRRSLEVRDAVRLAPLVQGNSGPAHFSVWFSLVVRMSQ